MQEVERRRGVELGEKQGGKEREGGMEEGEGGWARNGRRVVHTVHTVCDMEMFSWNSLVFLCSRRRMPVWSSQCRLPAVHPHRKDFHADLDGQMAENSNLELHNAESVYRYSCNESTSYT